MLQHAAFLITQETVITELNSKQNHKTQTISNTSWITTRRHRDMIQELNVNCGQLNPARDQKQLPSRQRDHGASQQAIELVQEIGRRTAVITEDSRETTFLFQRLSVALQTGNAVSFLGTFQAPQN